MVVGVALANVAWAQGFDPNGVKQIYPTQNGKAAPWTLGFDDWRSRALKFGDVTGSGKLTEVAKSGQVRMGVSSVEDNCEGITDQALALQRGYMCTPNDWYNFEMTGYVQLVTPAGASGDQDWTWYGGGGRHTGSGPPTGCMGSAYKASYHYKDAKVRVGKESWHVKYDYRRWKNVPNGIDYTANPNKWLGMKYIRYQFTQNGKRGVRNETWLDLAGIKPDGSPSNAWFLANVEEDHPDVGSWGKEATRCGLYRNDEVMLWGGPHATFRWDGSSSRIRLMSVREIVPPRQ
jgi:hypothetical protein